MKKAITLVFLTFLSAIGYTQQQTITICNEKNGCEFAKVNLTKHQIDNILEKSNFLAKEKCSPKLNSLFVIDLVQIVELMMHLSYSSLYQKHTSKLPQFLKLPD